MNLSMNPPYNTKINVIIDTSNHFNLYGHSMFHEYMKIPLRDFNMSLVS